MHAQAGMSEYRAVVPALFVKCNSSNFCGGPQATPAKVSAQLLAECAGHFEVARPCSAAGDGCQGPPGLYVDDSDARYLHTDGEGEQVRQLGRCTRKVIASGQGPGEAMGSAALALLRRAEQWQLEC